MKTSSHKLCLILLASLFFLFGCQTPKCTAALGEPLIACLQSNATLYVMGHTSPDLDSLAAASALAEYYCQHGLKARAFSQGPIPAKGLFVYEKLKLAKPSMLESSMLTGAYAIIKVDHNEHAQDLPFLPQEKVVEIVDHHRLDIPATKLPILLETAPIGSACTLVARRYMATGTHMAKSTAALLLYGLTTDTLNLSSPTATEIDRQILKELEARSGLSAAALLDELQSLPSEIATQPPNEVLNLDRKTYGTEGQKFSIAQIEECSLSIFLPKIPDYKKAMKEILEKEQLAFLAFVVTNPKTGNSSLLFFGDAAIEARLPFQKTHEGLYDLPGIVSRKRQILPAMEALLQ